MLPLPGNVYKSEIDLGLPFMVPDLVLTLCINFKWFASRGT
jgi:hypothetical protein